MKFSGFTVDFQFLNSYYICEMSFQRHGFDNFSWKRPSPVKNLIKYDVLTTKIYEILEKLQKNQSRFEEINGISTIDDLQSHICPLCARLICTGVHPWDIFFMNWQVWHWLCMIQGLLELDVSCIVWIFYQNRKEPKKCLVRISNLQTATKNPAPKIFIILGFN